MKTKAAIRFSKFEADPFGHGGHKRTTQVLELLERAKLKPIDFEATSAPISFSKKLHYFIKASKLLCKAKRFYGLVSGYKEAYNIALDWYRLKTLIDQNSKDYRIGHFIWEFTWSCYWYIPVIANRCGLQVIALPHNLESLVYSQRSHKPNKLLSPLWLNEELHYLDKANKIFCISREEQWLLSFYVNPNKVHYLPYHPPQANLEFLKAIRSERSKAAPVQQVVILGSAVNPPTFKGMMALKTHLLTQPNLGNGYDFVGFGVEWLIQPNELLPDNFVLSESVTNEVLREKLVETSCVLIHQIPSSGALTKIQEMCIAGVPVIVNSLGARSYYNLEGVYVYESFAQLDDILKSLDTLKTPQCPEPNVGFEKAFIDVF